MAARTKKLTPAQKAWATRRARGDDGKDAANKAVATRKQNQQAAIDAAVQAALAKAGKPARKRGKRTPAKS